uniref:CG15247-PA n=1 Tax=Macrostomum lignano TaxID=282301 RepID=A0A1I8JQ64_9PLAT
RGSIRHFDRPSGNAPLWKRPRRRPYGGPRRREFETLRPVLHESLRQQETSQHQLHLQQAAKRRMRTECNRPFDTRSMRDIRAPVASTSSVYGEFNMVRERYYQRSKRHLTSDELYDSSEAGSRRRHPIAPAASASSAAASGGGRSRRPILAEASSGLLSHIRHDRAGLERPQPGASCRQIEFTQLPADRGLRVNYDAQTATRRPCQTQETDPNRRYQPLPKTPQYRTAG